MGDEVSKMASNPIGAFTGAGAGSAAFGPAGMAIGAFAGAKNKLPWQSQVDVPGATPQPGWTLTTPDGKLRSDLMLNGQNPAAFKQSGDVLNKLQGMATTAGPTASAGYLMDANKRNTSNLMEQADAQGAQNLAQQTNHMAMRGGVDAGARERLGRNVGFDTLMSKQKIANDASGNNLEVLAKDEAQKLGIMQALPASLLAQAGFEQNGKQFDINNTLNTVGGKYNADMNAWGSNQAAREQAQLANKKNGLLGLGIGGLL